MKKVLGLSAAIGLLVAGNAFAADAIYQPAPEMGAAIYSWTGGYIGVNLGYAGGKAKHPVSVIDSGTTVASGSLNISSSGFVGGVQAGFNYQSDQWVYGVETDFQGSSVDAQTSINVGGLLDAEVGTKLNWYGTVRARIGFTPVERLLVYATGGLAYGETKSYIRLNGDELSAKKTKAGWTVGAGAEYAFADNWSLKSEYLYTDLGKANLITEELAPDVVGKLDRKFNFHTVRIGLNYKF